MGDGRRSRAGAGGWSLGFADATGHRRTGRIALRIVQVQVNDVGP